MTVEFRKVRQSRPTTPALVDILAAAAPEPLRDKISTTPAWRTDYAPCWPK